MKKTFLLLLLFMLMLSACMIDTPAPITGTPRSRSLEISPIERATVEPAYENENIPIQVAVLYQTGNAPRGVYEPSEGIYLAAWLAPHTSKRNFIQQSGKSHAVFVHEMHLDDEVPITWILQCIAALATPLFVVRPPLEEDCEIPIGDKISYLAQRLGTFQLPMFVAFYPPGHEMAPREYYIMFRYARALFMAHAPQVTFVWVAPGVESTVQNPFFPGHDAVDWVGVSLFAGRNKYGFVQDVIEQFKPFYHRFEAHHPIMVLPLGISHFSRADHTYHLQEAAAEIIRVYRELASFPRLGLVAYADAFGIAQTARDDFAISIENELMSAYAKAISNSHFISALEKDTVNDPQWNRSAFLGYYWEGRIYIAPETLQELSIPLPRSSVEINDATFVEASHISGADISFCDIRHVILVAIPD